MSFVVILFFLIILYVIRTGNKGYDLLLVLQLISLSTGFLVVRYVQFNSLLTLFNLLFSIFILYLLISPWRFANFRVISVKNKKNFKWFKKITEKFLTISCIINILIFVVVLIFIPDISKLKNEQGFRELYDSIPYFSFLFRFSSITTDLAYFAIPISIYYLCHDETKTAGKFFLLSLTTFFGYLASYSRAGILTYFLVVVGFVLLNLTLFKESIRNILFRVIKTSIILFGVIFLSITVVRFSAMAYYGDRIPSESYIKNPIVYNLFDYASQGFYNGINQLEFHSNDDISYGANTFYIICQVLSHFNVIDWSSENVYQQMEKAYHKPEILGENDYGSFHGYTCRMVKEYGYIFTFIITLVYHYIVKFKCKKKQIYIEELFVLIYLYIQPVICIFYHSIGVVLFPLIYYWGCKFIKSFKVYKRSLLSH